MNKIELFLKKNSTKILTVCGSIGVVTTSVLAVKATPKAMKLIELEKKNKNTKELKTIEKIKAGWKPYIPSIICGISTIGCIVGCHQLNTKRQAALVSAYDILNKSYMQYKDTVQDVYKLNEDNEIKRQILSKNYDNIQAEEDKDLFWDYHSMRWFYSTIEDIRKAQIIFNEHLSTNGYAYLNDWYKLIGMLPVEYGYELGWTTVRNDDYYSQDEVEFDLEKTVMDDGLECWILTMPYPPMFINL